MLFYFIAAFIFFYCIWKHVIIQVYGKSMLTVVMTGANGAKSKPTSAVDRLRNVHVAIMSDDTDLVGDAADSNY